MLAELDDTGLARRHHGGGLPADAERRPHRAAAHAARLAPIHRRGEEGE